MQDSEINFQNILVIDLGQMGDVVLSLPALKAIRDKYPDSRISVLTGKGPDRVLQMAGIADELINIDRVKLRDGNMFKSVAEIFRFVGKIKRRKFDLVIDLHSLYETNLLAYFSGAGKRLLADRENRSINRLSNFRPSPPPEDKSKHLTQKYLDVLVPLGITNALDEFRFEPLPADIATVTQKLFSAAGKRAGLFPGAGHPSRCWPLEKFAKLAEMLNTDGVQTIVFLGPEEARIKNAVTEIMPAETVIDDKLSIPEFVAAASLLDVFITNDTGPMHLAACAGAPIVLISDERAPTTFLPLTSDISIIRNGQIDSIEVETVFTSVADHLGNDKTGVA